MGKKMIGRITIHMAIIMWWFHYCVLSWGPLGAGPDHEYAAVDIMGRFVFFLICWTPMAITYECGVIRETRKVHLLTLGWWAFMMSLLWLFSAYEWTSQDFVDKTIFTIVVIAVSSLLYEWGRRFNEDC